MISYRKKLYVCNVAQLERVLLVGWLIEEAEAKNG